MSDQADRLRELVGASRAAAATALADDELDGDTALAIAPESATPRTTYDPCSLPAARGASGLRTWS